MKVEIRIRITDGPEKMEGKFNCKSMNYHTLWETLDLRPWLEKHIAKTRGVEKMLRKVIKKEHTIEANYNSDIQKLNNRINELLEMDKAGYTFCKTCGAPLETQILETYEALDRAKKGLEHWQSNT